MKKDKASATKPTSPAKTKRKEPREWRIKKVLRVLTYLTVICLLTGAFAARSAYGDVKRAALEIGKELGQIPSGPTRAVRLNGEVMNVASSTGDGSVSEVLDRMEAHCRGNSAALAKELDTLPEDSKKAFSEMFDARQAAGIIREDAPGRGMVACFVRDGRDDTAGVAQRLKDVVATGDLSAFGNLRYMFAEATAPGRTHIVAAWTDGPFNIYNFAPNSGDAPGSDLANVPRPPDAKRILSASVDGAPYSLRIYDAKGSIAEVFAVYDREMPERGWQNTPLDPKKGVEARAFHHEGVDLLVFASTENGRTVVSLVETHPR